MASETPGSEAEGPGGFEACLLPLRSGGGTEPGAPSLIPPSFAILSAKVLFRVSPDSSCGGRAILSSSGISLIDSGGGGGGDVGRGGAAPSIDARLRGGPNGGAWLAEGSIDIRLLGGPMGGGGGGGLKEASVEFLLRPRGDGERAEVSVELRSRGLVDGMGGGGPGGVKAASTGVRVRGAATGGAGGGGLNGASIEVRLRGLFDGSGGGKGIDEESIDVRLRGCPRGDGIRGMVEASMEDRFRG